MNWVQPKFTDFLSKPKAKRRKVDHKPSKEPMGDDIDGDIPQMPTVWAPTTKADLAVNKKKVDGVDQWLNSRVCATTPAIHSAQFLVLTGPPGSGKMTTLRVLCKERGVDLVEWCPQVAKRTYNPDSFDEYESELSLFEMFVLRATRYANVLSLNSRRLVVVKDIPNMFLRENSLFHELIEKSSAINNLRMAFIVTDPVILRDLFSESLKSKINLTTVSFNAATPTAIRGALLKVTKGDHLDVAKCISASCNGDIRHAIANVQFFAIKTDKTELVQRGNLPIDLFHSLGRVLYAKKDPSTGRLVHDPVPIGESYSSSPNLFLGMLHENYLNIFGSIRDVSAASVSLAEAELILSQLATDAVTNSSELGLVLACLGVVVNNREAVKRFQQMNRPSCRVTSVLTGLRNELIGVTDSSAVLDVMAFGKAIPEFATHHRLLSKYRAFRTN